MLNELRKGNIILAGGNKIIVDGISIGGVFDTNEKFYFEDNISPAPITLDALKEIGFAVNGISIMYESLIYLKRSTKADNWNFCMIGKGQLHTVKYLHSLQNLLYCFSNKDI